MILSKMSPLLPDEIITNILSRLPVKCLLRSKSVSKFWLSLIGSSYFIKMHLKQSVQSKDSLSLYMWDNYLYRLNFDFVNDHDLPPTLVNYSPLCFHDGGGATLWGSVDGLICISNSIDRVYIWNPSTRKSVQLPFTPLQIGKPPTFFQMRAYGFGYDRTNDDYKVVRLVAFQKDFSGDPIDYDIKVYSLKSNSWHFPEKFPHCPTLCKTRNTIAGGAMHWISTIKRYIVAFDIGTEKYRIIQQPKYSCDPNFNLYLGNLGDCLSLSCYYSSNVDVFLLKEYGEKNEHWSKIITLSPLNFSEPFRSVKTIAYSRCGKKVLLDVDFRSLVWYNLEKHVAEGIRVHGTEHIFKVETCLESLVSLNVSAGATNAKNKRDDTNDMKKFLSKGFKLVL